MKPNRRILYALLLAVASGLTACDRSDGRGDLTGPETPQFSSGTNNGKAFGHSKMEVQALVRTSALTEDVTYSTSTPIGTQGGVLTFGGNTLVIPKHAVRHWTHFTATLRAGDEIRVDMRAYDMFGAVTQFRRPVELTLDLSDAANADVEGIAVFYLNPNGEVEKMPSVLNAAGNSVTGYLNHFSDYIPGTLRNETNAVQP